MAKKTTTKAKVDPKVKVLEDLNEKVRQYNESAEFSEFKTMKKLDGEISELVDQYNKLAEGDCFVALKATKSPLFEAAKMLRYPTIRVRDVKQSEGGTERVVEPAFRKIDPLRLHKTTNDGIGADKNWWLMVEHLNYLICNREKVLLTGEVVDASQYGMSEGALDAGDFKTPSDAKFDLLSSKNVAVNKAILADIQTAVDAMIGTGYTVTPKMLGFVLDTYVKKDNKAMVGVVAPKHRYLRETMLQVCNMAITGNSVDFSHPVPKKKA